MTKLIGTGLNQIPTNAHLGRSAFLDPEDLPISTAVKVELKDKLDAIAAGATKNDTDANLKNRANHTGTQPVSTITGLGSAATADVTTGRQDTTSGRVLKVGDFGWGGNTPLLKSETAHFEESEANNYSTLFYTTTSVTFAGKTIPAWVTGLQLSRNGSGHGLKIIGNNSVLMFGSSSLNTVWHDGNFDPNTKLDASANAVSASKLATARTINGTSFNGSSNITTANWGSARNITIGGATKSINGSEDVSWSLEEIGVSTGGEWESQPIGSPIPIWTHLAGCPLPPNDPNEGACYIKLSAGDAFNTGLLLNETVSGSGVSTIATAVINCERSPLHGQTVSLINTERRFVRPGESGVLQDSANLSHDHSGSAASAGSHSHTGSTASAGSHSHTGSTGSAGAHTHSYIRPSLDTSANSRYTPVATGGWLYISADTNTGSAGAHSHSVSISSGGSHSHTVTIGSDGSHTHSLSINSSGTTEARPRNIGATYFMRIA